LGKKKVLILSGIGLVVVAIALVVVLLLLPKTPTFKTFGITSGLPTNIEGWMSYVSVNADYKKDFANVLAVKWTETDNLSAQLLFEWLSSEGFEGDSDLFNGIFTAYLDFVNNAESNIQKAFFDKVFGSSRMPFQAGTIVLVLTQM